MVTSVRFWVFVSGVFQGPWAQRAVGTAFPTPLSFSSRFKFKELGWPSCIQLDSFRQEGRGGTETREQAASLPPVLQSPHSAGHTWTWVAGGPGSGMLGSPQSGHCSLEQAACGTARAPTLSWRKLTLSRDPDSGKCGFKNPAPFHTKSGLPLSLNTVVIAKHLGQV